MIHSMPELRYSRRRIKTAIKMDPRKLWAIGKRVVMQNAPKIEIGKGYYCARYARIAAEKLFGLKYEKAHAWAFAEKNRLVWRRGINKEPYSKILKPGQILGINYPSSKFSKPNRLYTHVALFVGIKNGKRMIFHQWQGKFLKKDSLGQFLKKEKCELIDIIEPKTAHY